MKTHILKYTVQFLKLLSAVVVLVCVQSQAYAYNCKDQFSSVIKEIDMLSSRVESTRSSSIRLCQLMNSHWIIKWHIHQCIKDDSSLTHKDTAGFLLELAVSNYTYINAAEAYKQFNPDGKGCDCWSQYCLK